MQNTYRPLKKYLTNWKRKLIINNILTSFVRSLHVRTGKPQIEIWSIFDIEDPSLIFMYDKFSYYRDFPLICPWRPEIGRCALQENIALKLANESARKIGYKHEPYNSYWYKILFIASYFTLFLYLPRPRLQGQNVLYEHESWDWRQRVRRRWGWYHDRQGCCVTWYD